MNVRELSPELAKMAKEELNEDPERIPRDLQAIKDWLAKQPHINARTDDQWLVNFLRGCKFSLERTKEKLDMFYTVKATIPELTVCVDPLESLNLELLNTGVFLPLIKTGKPNSPRVIIIRPGAVDVTKIPLPDVMRLNFTFVTLQIFIDDQSIVAGQQYIIDLKGAGFSHFSQMTPSVVKKMTLSRQNALPLREKGTHHINTPSGAEKVISLVRMFLSEKNKKRLYLHGDNLDSLYEHVPKSILPTEYGGEGGSIQDIVDHWKKLLHENREWLLNDKLYKTDESKRPGTPKTMESIFGIEGSFRQLNID